MTRAGARPLVVIVGETGSGKSALGLELARRFEGEIIAADSRTVYKGMDIGTAKPTAEERRAVPHFGLDVVTPGQSFSAYDFKKLAERAIQDITDRGKVPIVVGGTGLYVDSLLYNFAFRPKPEPGARESFAPLNVEQLQERVLAMGLTLPYNVRNRRHLTRLLESGVAPTQRRRLRQSTVVLGLKLSQDVLRERIIRRVDSMVAAGLVDEVRGLCKQYGTVPEAFRAPGYKAFIAYLNGELGLAEAKEQFVRADLSLAKRQRTWFKRNKSIRWLDAGSALVEAVELVTALLDN